MKKYFYIFTLFAVVCLQAGVTDTPFATTIDECKTDIYFFFVPIILMGMHTLNSNKMEFQSRNKPLYTLQ